MGTNDKVSLYISIILTSLIIIPIILFIGLLTIEIRPYTRIFLVVLFSIFFGLSIPSVIMYLIGTDENRPDLINIGFGLAIPTWILSFIFSPLIASIYGQMNHWKEFYLILYIIANSTPLKHLFLISYILQPTMPSWILVFTIINLITTIQGIIFNSILFVRRKKLADIEKRNDILSRKFLMLGGIGNILYYTFTLITFISPLFYRLFRYRYYSIIFFIMFVLTGSSICIMGYGVREYHKFYRSKLANAAFIISFISGVSISAIFPAILFFPYYLLYIFYMLTGIGLIKIKDETRYPTFTLISGIFNSIYGTISIIIINISRLFTYRYYYTPVIFISSRSPSIFTISMLNLILTIAFSNLIGIFFIIESRAVIYSMEILKPKEEFVDKEIEADIRGELERIRKMPQIEDLERSRIEPIKKSDDINRIKKLKIIVQVSDRIKFDTMRDALDMDKKTFNEIIFDWAAEFGFIIIEDVVIFDKNTLQKINDKINALD
ncbi:MAG: hypothetical protein HWN67_09260 [Candidatus Helarchaeota archaeon]|nr:hypothetical protein [Candidatus Helarchaeota archaeon]